MAIVNDKTLVRYEFLEFLLRTDPTSFCIGRALDVQFLPMHCFVVFFLFTANPHDKLFRSCPCEESGPYVGTMPGVANHHFFKSGAVYSDCETRSDHDVLILPCFV